MKERVLILCTANSARSQMAEGLLRDLGGERFEIYSAGSRATTVNRFAIEAMLERGLDIGDHRSQSLKEFVNQPFDYVMTVCDNAAESCPVFPGRAQRVHWGFPDPAAVEGAPEERLSAFREVRNAIEQQLRQWLDSNPSELAQES